MFSPVGGKAKPTRISIQGTSVRAEIDMYMPVTFRANPRAGMKADEPEYILNSYSRAVFRKVSVPGMPDTTELIRQHMGPYQANLNELMELHASVKDDAGYTAMIECDIQNIRADPIGSGNYMIQVDDESLGFGTEDEPMGTVTCFVPESIFTKHVDFGEGSRVFIFGRVTTGQGWNFETGQPNPEITRPLLNVTGIYPLYKVSPDEVLTLEPDDLGDWKS